MLRYLQYMAQNQAHDFRQSKSNVDKQYYIVKPFQTSVSILFEIAPKHQWHKDNKNRKQKLKCIQTCYTQEVAMAYEITTLVIYSLTT